MTMSTTIDTPPAPALTTAQRELFLRDGYLIMRGLAAAERVNALRRVTLEHVDAQIAPIEYEADVAYPGAPASRAATGGDTPRRLRQAYDRDPVFADWGADGRLSAILAQLLESETVYLSRNHHNCVMTKSPRYSTATAWHRDLRYWSFQTPRLVNAWLALGDETRANGCMRLLPATQHLPIEAERLDSAQFLREDRPDNAELIESAVTAELAPGDVLFFDAGVFHAAGANTTDERKLSLVTTYYGADNAPMPDTRSARLAPITVRSAEHAA